MKKKLLGILTLGLALGVFIAPNTNKPEAKNKDTMKIISRLENENNVPYTYIIEDEVTGVKFIVSFAGRAGVDVEILEY